MILLPLLLILDASTLVGLGAAVLVDLGKAANLAKSVFFSILVLDVLALNLIVRWLLGRIGREDSISVSRRMRECRRGSKKTRRMRPQADA